jgi:DNA-binding NarL/FixJ family response regulator
VIHVMVVSPVQAVRFGLRVMLAEKSSTSAMEDFSQAYKISDAAGLGEIENWLDEVDVLVLTAGAALPGDMSRLAGQHEGRLAVLLLADQPQAAAELATLPLRAWGVLTSDCSAEELKAAVNAVNESLIVGSPALISPGFARVLAAGGSTQGLDSGEIVEPLTRREIEILQFLALGLSNKQIAARLSISEHTVKFHTSSIYTKLGVASRTEAVRAGVQRGLISL